MGRGSEKIGPGGNPEARDKSMSGLAGTMGFHHREDITPSTGLPIIRADIPTGVDSTPEKRNFTNTSTYSSRGTSDSTFGMNVIPSGETRRPALLNTNDYYGNTDTMTIIDSSGGAGIPINAKPHAHLGGTAVIEKKH